MVQPPKRALGKGLEALIPKKNEISAVAGQAGLCEIPLGQIVANPYQPRQEMPAQELKELSASIKENGFIQPLVVRKLADNQYELIAGGRRFEAARQLGLLTVPALIKNVSDQESFILAIVENLQRQDLNAIEEAQAFKRLMDEFAMNLDDIARFAGKDKTTIANSLRLLKLPVEMQKALQKGLISRSQARTILGLPQGPEQIKLFQEILSGPLTVREMEARAKKARIKTQTNKADLFAGEIEQKLQVKLGTKVKIFNKKNNSGKIVIEYFSLDDMERIIRRLG